MVVLFNSQVTLQLNWIQVATLHSLATNTSTVVRVFREIEYIDFIVCYTYFSHNKNTREYLFKYNFFRKVAHVIIPMLKWRSMS
jgi:hypothetical protein